MPSPSSPSSTLPAGYAGDLAIPGWDLFYRGKVRDLYRNSSHPGHMLMVATDRLSAFDVVMAETIPDRGKILTHITEYWLQKFQDRIGSARLTCDPREVPDLPAEVHQDLAGRMTWTREADRVNVEVVLRARLAGSGWREYEATGRLWDHDLPAGLQNSSALPQVLHTPTTKAEVDEPISWQQAVNLIGDAEEAQHIHTIALDIFQAAAKSCAQQGVILADTKFEFGRIDGKLVLIDEVMTPDSSRYWPANKIAEGHEPPSWDKEIVRAYLRSVKEWNRQAPPPSIPSEIIQHTRQQYLAICEILTGTTPV